MTDATTTAAAWHDTQSRYARLANASAQLERLRDDETDEWVVAALDAMLDDLARLSGPHFVRASALPRQPVEHRDYYNVVCETCGDLESYTHEPAAQEHRTTHHDVQGHRVSIEVLGE